MNTFRSGFNLDNPAILIGAVFGLSGLVGAIAHGQLLNGQLLIGGAFLFLGLLYELRPKQRAQ